MRKKDSSSNKKEFAFLIHPPELKDVAKKFPFSKFIPGSLLAQLLKILPPLIGGRITGFKLPSGEEVKGWIIICPLTAQQLMDYPELGKKKVLQSVKLAERLGCKYIGLGAFTSIVTDGGFYLSDKVNIGLTTGNAYAAALILENLFKSTVQVGMELGDSSVAVVGAAGSVGSACSRILSSRAKKIILIDERKEELKELAEELSRHNKNLEFYSELPAPISADAVITVTSASEGIVKSRHLRPATVVIDAAQPHNVAPEVITERKDVLIINSGIAQLSGINLNMNVGLGKDEIYACLGETLMSVYRNWQGHYSLGQVNPQHVEETLYLAPQIGLAVAEFRNASGKISQADLAEIKKIREGRK